MPKRLDHDLELIRDELFSYAKEFLENIETSSVHLLDHPDLRRSHEFFGPKDFSQVLKRFHKYYRANSADTASGRFLGYVPGGGLPIAAVGDFLAALTNAYSGFRYVSLGAQLIEEEVIDWMKGYYFNQDESWGVLTSGGSMANLTALLAAREDRPQAPIGKRRVYVCESAHKTVVNAFYILGYQQEEIIKVPLDHKLRLDYEALGQLLERDLVAGLTPTTLVINAGSTNYGQVDDIAKAVDFRDRYKLWLHVDAAYGGFFALVPKIKECFFKGIDQVDSITLDPHKGLFMPYGTGALLVKEQVKLKNCIDHSAAYLQGLDEHNLSQCEYSIELTRHFRALRVWFCLHYYGEEFFVDKLTEKRELTQYFISELLKKGSFEVYNEADLSVVTFGQLDQNGNYSRELTEELVKRVNDSNEIFLTSTMIEDRYCARICILHFRTQKQHIDMLLELV